MPTLEPANTPNFALYDARGTDPDLVLSSERSACVHCLYSGPSADTLASVAPYIEDIPDTARLAEVKNDGNPKIFLHSGADLEDTRKHFRKFTFVALEDGRTMYFRFYDPLVLNVFLPTCSADQLASFFGPTDAFWAPSEDSGGWIRYSLTKGRLEATTVSL